MVKCFCRTTEYVILSCVNIFPVHAGPAELDRYNCYNEFILNLQCTRKIKICFTFGSIKLALYWSEVVSSQESERPFIVRYCCHEVC